MTPILRLYNTLSRQIEPFVPLEPGKVRLYVCGPTVYDEAHLGHARCYITWDVLYRFLRYLHLEVTYVRNITDVDDKILARAAENGESPEVLAIRYTERFHAIMHRLHVLPPTHEPRATRYVSDSGTPMVTMIQGLLDKGLAYETPSGTVYFDTQKSPRYGSLCHQNLDELQSGARVDVDPEKQSPLDFALWKPALETEPLVWPAPWGKPGRPGWHIECSAMSHSLLGDQLDIHAGGMDLIFPHHENEIAQSEGYTGKTPFVQYWLHNGFVNVSGEKMSKSLGNFSTIDRLLDRYDANTLRYFLLTHHYRSPVDFSTEALEGAENRMKKLYQHLQSIDHLIRQSLGPDYTVLPQSPQTGTGTLQTLLQALPPEKMAFTQLGDAWTNAMADDLNTSKALSYLDQLIDLAVEQSQEARSTEHIQWVTCIAQYFLVYAGVMGFAFTQPLNEQLQAAHASFLALYTQLIAEAESQGLTLEPLDTHASPQAVVQALVDLRTQTRQAKNWGLSDMLRDGFASQGIAIRDLKNGMTTWYYDPQ